MLQILIMELEMLIGQDNIVLLRLCRFLKKILTAFHSVVLFARIPQINIFVLSADWIQPTGWTGEKEHIFNENILTE